MKVVDTVYVMDADRKQHKIRPGGIDPRNVASHSASGRKNAWRNWSARTT